MNFSLATIRWSASNQRAAAVAKDRSFVAITHLSVAICGHLVLIASVFPTDRLRFKTVRSMFVA